MADSTALANAERILDGVMNYMTLMGSRVDPNQSNLLIPDCDRDRLTWYKNGGLADKIVNFWGNQIGTGLEISIAAKQSERGKKEASKLQEWLQSEYKRLDVLNTLKMAQLQCNIERAAPMLVYTDSISPRSQTGFDRVVALKICNPEFLLPHSHLPIVDETEPVDHRFVTSYQQLKGSSRPGSLFSADRVLAMQGRKLLPCEGFSLQADWRDLQWGMPLISTQTIEAAMKYDLAISLAMVILHKKDMMVQKFSGLFKIAADPNASEQLAAFVEIAKKLQISNNVTNVALVDKDLTDIDILDRNLSGVDEIIDKVKDYLLAACPNIPQAHLFGRHERTGGLSATNDEKEDVNAHAQMLFNERWLPLLEKLNRVLVASSSCPVKNANLDSISVLRKSGYTPDPLEMAKVKEVYTNIDKTLADAGAIDRKEMRSRHIGSEFKYELLLESAEPPEVEEPEEGPTPAVGKEGDEPKPKKAKIGKMLNNNPN